MLKKILSVFLSVLMVMSLVMIPAMGVSANTETVDITDYTPGDIPAGLTLGNMGTNPGNGITVTCTSNWRATAAASRDDSLITNDFMRPMVGLYWGLTSGITAGSSYVISFNVKNKSAEPVIPNVVFGLLDGGQKWLGQYTWAENVASSDWTTIKKTFTIEHDGTQNTRLSIGLGAGNTNNEYVNKENFDFRPNAVLDFNNASVYIAPEEAYNVENTLSAAKTMAGAIVTGNAMVINQIGETGNLDQDMAYYVTDSTGTVNTDFAVTVGDNGAYEIAVGEDVADGDYYVVARSAKYNVGKETNFIQDVDVLTVETVDYSDTENIAVADYVTANGSAKADWGVTKTVSNGMVTFTAKAAQGTTPSDSHNRPCDGWYWTVDYRNDSVEGDTWVVRFKVKRLSENVVPNVVFGMTHAGMKNSWTNQTVYSEDITSMEWQTIEKTFKVLSDGSASSIDFSIGLGQGNTHNLYNGETAYEFRPGASVMVDIESIYVGKDSIAGITNTAPLTKVFAGNSISAEAAVVNAAGTKGTLDQSNFDFVVLNEQRTAPAAGITTTKGTNGAYTINVAEGVPAGTYVAVASYTVDETTTLRKGLEFTVETIDKYTTDYEAGSITTDVNCVIDGSAGSGNYGISSINDATTNYKYRITAAAERANSDIPSAANRPMHGTIWNYNGNNNNGNLTQGTTYVLKFKAKNVNEAVTPYVVFGLVHEANRWTNEYVWAEKVTSAEWQEFKKTFTFNHSGDGTYTSLRIGLGTGSTAYSGSEFAYYPNASIDIDDTSYYLAPEAVHDITVTPSAQLVRSGASITAEASVVNQIGMEGTLKQNFSWAALNSSKTALAEGINITADDDSSVVTISFDDDVALGKYVIAAYSEDYSIAKSFTVEVSNKASIENVEVNIDTKTVTFDAVNIANGGFSGAVYVAELAAGSETFVKAERVPFTLDAGNTSGKKVTYTLEADEANDIKVYIWDNALTPYIQPVQKKKQIILIGDSITRDGRYQNYLEAFMLTRYPDNYVSIANGGDDGDTAAGFMSKRFKYDVQDKEAVAAFVCFGANDAGGSAYLEDSTAGDELKAEMIKGAKANLERVILALKADGVDDITLLTPVTYDDRTNFTYGDNNATGILSNYVGYSDAMALVAANVLDLAEQYGLKAVDTNAITTAIMEDAIAKGYEGEVIYQPDRIHPNTRGHFVIASKIIETLYGEDAIVASVEIDAEDAYFYAENAEVSDLSASDDGVSYTYLAKSLPMGVDEAGYEAVHELYGEFVNFTESMNQEIIKITNLAEGSYTIAFDGVEIGEYSAEELSKGINIAVNPLNPGQIAAKRIIDSYMTNLYNIQYARVFELVENALKREGMFYGTTIEEKMDWADVNQKNYKNVFRQHYADKDIYINKVNKLKKDAYAMAQPVAHKVTVTPVAQ